MPLDKKRIEGFGGSSSVLQCPEGHNLQSWNARAGYCDGCRKRVNDGDTVMDCRRCNFYLCASCQTTYTPPDNSIWGAFSSMVEFVKQDFAEMAADLRALAGDEDDAEPAGAAQPAAQEEASGEVEPPQTWVSPHEREEAQEIFAEFCERYPEQRATPDEDALESLWTRVSLLYGCSLHPGPIALAVCQQLRMPKDDQHWQPRLRALVAVAFFHDKGAVGREISNAIARRAEELIRRLVAVAECREAALELLQLHGKDVSPDCGEPTPTPGVAGAAAAAVLSKDRPPPPSPPPTSKAAAPASSPAAASPAASVDLLDLPPEEPPSVIPSLSPPVMLPGGTTRANGSGDLLDLL